MRILSAYPELSGSHGGPPRAVIDLADAMVEAGHEVTVVTLRAPDAPERWLEERSVPEVTELGGPSLPGDPLLPTRRGTVRRLVGSHDVVLLRGMWSLMNVQVAAEARRLGVPYVLTPDGMLDDWSIGESSWRKHVFLRLLGNDFLAGAAAIHCTAEAERAQVRQRVPTTVPIVVIPNLLVLDDLMGAHDRRYPGDTTTGPDIPTVLFLSRLHPVKRPELAIEAFAMADINARLVIAGDGDPAYVRGLREFADERALADRIDFVGFVTGERRSRLYQESAVLLLPSQQENFGNVYFEALAAGTHLVMTTGPDTWRELRSSGNATVVPPEPRVIAEALSAAIQRPKADAEADAERGRRWIERFLDRQRIVEAWETLVADVTSSDGSSRVSDEDRPLREVSTRDHGTRADD